MMVPNPIEGIGLHAVGATAASTCYLPYHKTTNWSWVSYWLIQSLFAWILTPLVLALLTVPDFFGIIQHAPTKVLWLTFLFGGIYGFGGMSFGFATRYIGYSLTYAISIGISAVLGTILPLMMHGTIGDYFQQPGGHIIAFGMLVAIVGVSLCGWAGFKKEQEIKQNTPVSAPIRFNMRTGLLLAITAGILSGIFNIALELGQPISDIAAQKGAGIFEGNAKLIIATSGCFVVNFIWFSLLALKEKRFKEFSQKHYKTPKDSPRPSKALFKNLLWSSLGGILWCMQFFFYGLGHVKMGKLQFASWVIHMSMLIFFSFLVGIAMKEWKSVSKSTYGILITALVTLAISFVIMSYAGM
ncbi:L-rhamnose/proton symporter RhaT [Arachidicoccus ginsenosidivorans]|uniref:Rhamnose:proton symporter n=1 Tax=Arachidicoccus ginsenosidivorans TaxID=496057 RepID=A0A5B8VIN5_9BACT|nr:L-rhamnose/proton symporter RhaT [Arachidicoccus ginsenosidivorans]QEC70802.1 rhamnose:proton symporter [Arachidicoccus ginsenosidivorans]